MSSRISAPKTSDVVTPVTFKNWFTVLSVYLRLRKLAPSLGFTKRVPLCPNPTVESTTRVVASVGVISSALVLPGTSKDPSNDVESSDIS